MKTKTKNQSLNFNIPYVSLEIVATSKKIIKNQPETLDHLVKILTSFKKLGIECEEVFYSKKKVNAYFVLNSGRDLTKRINFIKQKLQLAIDTL